MVYYYIIWHPLDQLYGLSWNLISKKCVTEHKIENTEHKI